MNSFYTSYSNIFLSLTPLFCISLFGAYSRYKGWYESAATRSFSWLLIHFFQPFLIFDVIMSNSKMGTTFELIEAASVGFLAAAGGITMSYFIAKKIGFSQSVQSILSLSSGLFNYSYLPIPLLMLFSTPQMLTELLLFNIGVEIAIWSVGVYILHTVDKTVQFTWKKIITPPLLALLISCVSYGPLHHIYIIQGIQKNIHMIGQATIPIVFLFLGALVFDYIPDISICVVRKKELIVAIILRMCLFPLLFVISAYTFPISEQLRTILFVEASMPSAVVPIILAQRANKEIDLAVLIVICTTLISLFTIPIWFYFIF